MCEAARVGWLEKLTQRGTALGLDEHVRAAFETEVRQLVAAAPASPPALGTPEDQAVLRGTVSCLRTCSALGPRFGDVLADVGDEELDELLREEYEAATSHEKLVLHQLRDALRTYAQFSRAAAARLRAAGLGDLSELVDWDELIPAQDDALELLDGDLTYFRGLAALLVAVTRVTAPGAQLSEWAGWAHLASRSARKSEPLMQSMLTQLDAEAPELRARRAWDSWTAAEVAEELAPWPGESSA